MRIAFVPLAALLCLSCSKDREVQEFIRENDSLVAEIKKTGDPDAARQAFDAKKDALKSKLDSLKDVRGFQIEEESLSALGKSLNDGVTTICSLDAVSDAAKSTKYKSLCDDYAAIMKTM